MIFHHSIFLIIVAMMNCYSLNAANLVEKMLMLEFADFHSDKFELLAKQEIMQLSLSENDFDVLKINHYQPTNAAEKELFNMWIINLIAAAKEIIDINLTQFGLDSLVQSDPLMQAAQLSARNRFKFTSTRVIRALDIRKNYEDAVSLCDSFSCVVELEQSAIAMIDFIALLNSNSKDEKSIMDTMVRAGLEQALVAGVMQARQAKIKYHYIKFAEVMQEFLQLVRGEKTPVRAWYNLLGTTTYFNAKTAYEYEGEILAMREWLKNITRHYGGSILSSSPRDHIKIAKPAVYLRKTILHCDRFVIGGSLLLGYYFSRCVDDKGEKYDVTWHNIGAAAEFIVGHRTIKIKSKYPRAPSGIYYGATAEAGGLPFGFGTQIFRSKKSGGTTARVSDIHCLGGVNLSLSRMKIKRRLEKN